MPSDQHARPLGTARVWRRSLWAQEGDRLPGGRRRTGGTGIRHHLARQRSGHVRPGGDRTRGDRADHGRHRDREHLGAQLRRRRGGVHQAEKRSPGSLLLGLGNGPATRPSGHCPLSRTDAVPGPPGRGGRPGRGQDPGGSRTPLLALSAARSRGAHPFLITPDHTASARTALGPGPLLRRNRRWYWRRTRPTARAMLASPRLRPDDAWHATNLRFGFTVGDLAYGGSDRLIDATVAWEIRTRRWRESPTTTRQEPIMSPSSS